MDNRIEKAREDWFANHPFEPNKHSVLAHDEDGLPAGFFTLPDMGDMSIVSLKYGYEFLAAVRTDDDQASTKPPSLLTSQESCWRTPSVESHQSLAKSSTTTQD